MLIIMIICLAIAMLRSVHLNNFSARLQVTVNLWLVSIVKGHGKVLIHVRHRKTSPMRNIIIIVIAFKAVFVFPVFDLVSKPVKVVVDVIMLRCLLGL